MIDLLESIFQTHQPTWDDCRQLLLTLFNTEEERCRILSEARAWLQGQAPIDRVLQHGPQGLRQTPGPLGLQRPEQKRVSRQYQQAILQGVKAGARKPADTSRSQRSRPQSCMGDCARRSGCVPLLTPKHERTSAWSTQHSWLNLNTDIRRHLQKLEGFAGMSTTQLLEVAN